jgi:hypothetical protein
MKKIFLGLTLIFCVSGVSSYAQAIAPTTQAANTQNSAMANIVFKEKENTHDFGTVPQGTPVSCNFNFTNTGKAPLVLTAVNPSCGCTSPEWPHDAIAPGASAVIKVTYNAANPGTFTKNVTVVSNASVPQTILYIKGEVKPSAQATNASQPAGVSQAVAPKKS